MSQLMNIATAIAERDYDGLCRSCRWWQMTRNPDSQLVYGACRYLPPTVVGDMAATEWPKTRQDHFCSRWEAAYTDVATLLRRAWGAGIRIAIRDDGRLLVQFPADFEDYSLRESLRETVYTRRREVVCELIRELDNAIDAVTIDDISRREA